MKIIDFTTVEKRILPYIRQTPVSYDPKLNLHIKWENHQYTHSFKLRGVLNKILSMSPQQQKMGIITASSGNHGIGLAYVAQKLGITAHVCVPKYTSSCKVNLIKIMDATVEQISGSYENAELKAKDIAARTGAIYVSCYNDWDIITGNGTVALEWFEQTLEEFSQLLIPLGGGTLLCGLALAARRQYPNIRVVGVQAEASPYLHHQFHYGHMENINEYPTIMEGLAGMLEEGSITASLISELCDDVILVNDDDVKKAIAYAYHEFGEIAEASGVVGLAAVLANKVSTKYYPIGTIITGGNINPQFHSNIIKNNNL